MMTCRYTAIHAIQGNGAASPLATQAVRTAGNVVTNVGPAGFTIQTPDADADADPLTSQGVYVFTTTAPTYDNGAPVQVGDEVSVLGTAIEFFTMTEVSVTTTRNASNSITVTATGEPLPTAVVFSSGSGLPSTDPAALSCGTSNFECYEGMLVSIPAGRVSSGNQRFSTDLFGEVYIDPRGSNSLREPGVRFGSSTYRRQCRRRYLGWQSGSAGDGYRLHDSRQCGRGICGRHPVQRHWHHRL
jgi:predicted extracellular nuclease